MDLSAAMGMMGGGETKGSKYAPKSKETIPDKYTAQLAQDNLMPAVRAQLEKMQRRRGEREAAQADERAAALEASLTPAHRAAMAGDAAALGALELADLSARSTLGQTPAHLAAQAGAAGCGALEVFRGHAAARDKGIAASAQAAALLVQPDDEGNTPAHLAAAADNAEGLQLLFAMGALPDAAPRTQSVLHAAVWANASAAVAALCELLPPVAARAANADGATPAHLAAQLGLEECLALVISHGGPECVAVRRTGGAAPPHDAAFHGSAACLCVLHEALPGCIGWLDDDGDTPFHAAAARGHAAALSELLDAAQAIGGGLFGAGSMQNSKGEAPMTLAGMSGHTNCVDLLDRDAAMAGGGGFSLTLIADQMKGEGNLLTKAADFPRAAACYERGIALYSPQPPPAPAPEMTGGAAAPPPPPPPSLATADIASVLDDPAAVEVLLSLCTNLALVRSKTGEHGAAVQAADDALLLKSDCVKALHRKGTSLTALGDYGAAKEVFNAALVSDPANEPVKKALAQCAAKQKKEKAREKKMAQKMFG